MFTLAYPSFPWTRFQSAALIVARDLLTSLGVPVSAGFPGNPCRILTDVDRQIRMKAAPHSAAHRRQAVWLPLSQTVHSGSHFLGDQGCSKLLGFLFALVLWSLSPCTNKV